MAGFSDSRREVCERLADLLATTEGLRVARRFQHSGFFDIATGKGPHAYPAAPVTAGLLQQRCLGEKPVPIGIWKPGSVENDGCWIRDHASKNAEWWAPQPVLRRKTKDDSRIRICLLGESAAAGWLYAPHVTPAKVLQTQLEAVRPGIFDVVDLSAVNLQALQLRDLAAASLQLAPDVLVIFAGNNWPAGLPSYPGASLAEFQAAAAALRQRPASLMELSTTWTAARARHVVDVIGELARMSNVRLVWIVPEVNLADWPRHRPVAWLPEGGVRRWYELMHHASASLAAGRFDDAADAATEMIALDGGACATGYDLLARCDAARGRIESARRWFRMQVDARSWDDMPRLPSATTTIQDAIRDGARTSDAALVDLPDVFARYLPDHVPGRRLFLDYCHLTVEGMTVAMAAVTATLLRIESHATAGGDWQDVLSTASPVETLPAVDAAARLFAALYCLRFASTLEDERHVVSTIAREWIGSALVASDTIREPMLAWIASREAPLTAAPLSAASRRFWRSLEARPPFAPERPAHIESVAMFCAALNVPVPDGAPPPGEPADLLDPSNCWHDGDRHQDSAGLAHQATLAWRAKLPVSRFCLPVIRGRCEIHIVARSACGDRLAIELNGQPLVAVRIGPRWTTHRVGITPAQLKQNMNQLSFHWPLPRDEAGALHAVAETWELGRPADVHPVFGELARLRIVVPARTRVTREPPRR